MVVVRIILKVLRYPDQLFMRYGGVHIQGIWEVEIGVLATRRWDSFDRGENAGGGYEENHED